MGSDHSNPNIVRDWSEIQGGLDFDFAAIWSDLSSP